MPALVTTPSDAVLSTVAPSTKYTLNAQSIPVSPPRVAPVNATITRVSTGVPIRRWDGSAWVTLYRPRV